MKLRRLRFKKGFRVVPGNRRSQAAEMVIPPGESEGDAGNRHRGAYPLGPAACRRRTTRAATSCPGAGDDRG